MNLVWMEFYRSTMKKELEKLLIGENRTGNLSNFWVHQKCLQNLSQLYPRFWDFDFGKEMLETISKVYFEYH